MYLIPVVALNATVIVIIAIWALAPRNLTEATTVAATAAVSRELRAPGLAPASSDEAICAVRNTYRCFSDTTTMSLLDNLSLESTRTTAHSPGLLPWTSKTYANVDTSKIRTTRARR